MPYDGVDLAPHLAHPASRERPSKGARFVIIVRRVARAAIQPARERRSFSDAGNPQGPAASSQPHAWRVCCEWNEHPIAASLRSVYCRAGHTAPAMFWARYP